MRWGVGDRRGSEANHLIFRALTSSLTMILITHPFVTRHWEDNGSRGASRDLDTDNASNGRDDAGDSGTASELNAKRFQRVDARVPAKTGIAGIDRTCLLANACSLDLIDARWGIAGAFSEVATSPGRGPKKYPMTKK